ncbi:MULTISPECIES: hypothetical protein [Sulfitobacter]|uniref:hypothetical protein n=2 Tax=Sulfitobacter TaxID=60136 RepID=UPI000066AF39|nr:hypothetical protein EE36_12933 [Sulfitobacter sp. EE-36]
MGVQRYKDFARVTLSFQKFLYPRMIIAPLCTQQKPHIAAKRGFGVDHPHKAPRHFLKIAFSGDVFGGFDKPTLTFLNIRKELNGLGVPSLAGWLIVKVKYLN